MDPDPLDPTSATPNQAAIVRAYPAILAVALARLRDVDAAEDLAQEVVVRGLLRIDQLRDPARLQAWLVAAARHLAANWQRDAARRVQSQRALAQLLPRDNASRPQVRAMIDQQTHQQILEESLAGMDDADREIVMLHFVAGMPKNRIAETLGVHPATVGRRLDKALEHLKTRALDKLSSTLRESSTGLAARKRLQQAALTVLALDGSRRAALAAELDAIETLPATFAAGTATGTFTGIAATLSSVPAIIAGVCAALLITTAVVINIAPSNSSQATEPTTQTTATVETSRSTSPPITAPSTSTIRTSTSTNEDDIDALLANIPPSEPVRAYIEGRYVDENGEPVAGADIRLYRQSLRLMDEPMYSRKTDADGRYRFDDVAAGIYLYEYKAEGYRLNPAFTLAVNVGATKLGGKPPAIIEGEGDEIRGRFYWAGARLHGILVDAETDQPIENAQLDFIAQHSGRRFFLAKGRSDDQGSFLIEHLFPDMEGKIIIRADGYEITPSKPIKATDSPIIIEARKGGQTATLHITREDNEPLDAVTLGLYHKDMDLVHVRKPDADGIVSFDALPNGRYAVVAFDTAPERMQYLHAISLDVSAHIPQDTVREFAIPSLVRIKGIVRDADTLEAVPDALLRASASYESDFMGIATLELLCGDTVRVDGQGRFNAPFNRVIKSSPNMFVMSETHNYAGLGYEFPGPWLDTKTAAGNHDVRLRRVPVISGRLLAPDGKPVSSGRVITFEHKDGKQINHGNLDPVRIAPDGTYLARPMGAVAGSHIAIAAQTSDGLYAFDSIATEESIYEYEKDLQSVRGEETTLLVTNEGGEPLANARIRWHIRPQFFDDGSPAPGGEARTDQSGSIQTHVPVGWKVTAAAIHPEDESEYAEAKRESFDPVADKTIELRIVGRPTTLVTGIVVDTESVPIPDASIMSLGAASAVKSDENGHFEITVEPSYPYLNVSADGFWFQGLRYLADYQEGELLRVMLPKYTPAIVRLRDQHGNPIVGPVLVESIVYGAELFESYGSPSEFYRTTATPYEADQNGEFEMEFGGYLRQEFDPNAVAFIAAYREGQSIGFSQLLQFPTGSQDPLTIELVLENHSRTGRILDAVTRKPVADAIIQTDLSSANLAVNLMISQERLRRPIDRTDAEGRFSLNMMTGNETHVSVYHKDYGERIVPIPSSGEIQLQLSPGITMEGEVVIPEALGIEYWNITITPTEQVGPRHTPVGQNSYNLPEAERIRYRVGNVPDGDMVLKVDLKQEGATRVQASLEWLVVPPANTTGTWHHDIHVPPMVEVKAYARRGDIMGHNPRMLAYRLTRTTNQDPRVILNPQWSMGDDETQHFHTLLAPPGEYRVEVQEQVGNDWNTIETGQTILIGEGIEARLMPQEVRARLEGAE